jgi:hypothetical protein
MTVTTSVRDAQRWTFPSELAGDIPRDVELAPAGRVVAALATALGVAALAAAIVLSIPTGVPLWAIPLIPASLLAAVWGIVHGLRRSWMLLSEGRAAQARVVNQKKVHRDKHTAYQITCEFRDLSGATHTMRYDVMKAPPAIGSELTIVYHRDDPRWHAVYPLRLVRPVRAPQRAHRTRGRESSFLAGHG